MTFKPLTEQDMVEHKGSGAFYVDDVLSALKGLKGEIKLAMKDRRLTVDDVSFMRLHLKQIDKWFPILKSQSSGQALKTNDSIPDSLEEGKRQVDCQEKTGICFHEHLDYVPCFKEKPFDLTHISAICLNCKKEWITSFSQPFSKASRSSEDEVSSKKGSRSSVGDAGELFGTGEPDVKDATPRKRKCIHKDFPHSVCKIEDAGASPRCRNCSGVWEKGDSCNVCWDRFLGFKGGRK